ncbi:2-dehydropantoate 2-reductase [Ammonicoccus fulvus]|uniref:2-dehydropantoate 2-reductase n=1 Tax=Ammonicoccus fulvus TaxID=3138240 RepID=A0ABZ3FRJ1_9ACTN
MQEIQRVAIVGAGAMGGMYAAHFAEAGFEVVFVASGERAARLRDGLTVNGTPLLADVVDAESPGDATAADLMIFAVKDQHLNEAIREAEVIVGSQTIVLSVMNGLDSEERIAHGLACTLDRRRVLLCIALAMDAEREGRDIRFRQAGKLVFGHPRNDEPDEVVTAVQRALTRAQLAWETPADMRHELWWKFMVNVGMNQTSAVLRAPYGALQPDGDPRSLMSALIDEVVLVAAAEGVPMTEADVERWHRVLANQPAEGWTSMAQDVLAGRPTEVETFAGRMVALGEKHGIPVPYNQAMLWILRSTTPH